MSFQTSSNAVCAIADLNSGWSKEDYTRLPQDVPDELRAESPWMKPVNIVAMSGTPFEQPDAEEPSRSFLKRRVFMGT